MERSCASRWQCAISLIFFFVAFLTPLMTVHVVGASPPIVVNSTSDSGTGTLRDAITTANGASGADTINVSIAGSGAHTIALSSPLPAITDDLTINGTSQTGYAGTPLITIDGGSHQIFSITSGIVKLTALTIQHGNNAGALGGCIQDSSSATVTLTSSTVTNCIADYGGGIIVNNGTMDLNDSTVSNSTAINTNGAGGGIYVFGGAVNLTNSVVSGNTVTGNFSSSIGPLGPGGVGGGIQIRLGSVTLTNSTVSNNETTGAGNLGGAGIANFGTLTVNNSTFSGNGFPTSTPPSLPNQGGGILTVGGALTVSNSTFTGNAAYDGGGIAGGIVNPASGPGSMTITGSTFTGNFGDAGTGLAVVNGGGTAIAVSNSTFSGDYQGSAGGSVAGLSSTIALTNDTFADSSSSSVGVANSSGTITLQNSLVADRCSGTITDGHHNLDSGSTCGFTDATDMQNTNPQLGPLQDNGGPTTPHTLTRALMPGSPAIDKIPAAGGCGAVITTDQRGTVRPQPASGLCDIGAYEYVPVTPTIGSLTVNHGPITGGTNLTINGTGFQTGSGVTFGGTSGAVTAVAPDGTSLTVTTPAHTPPGLVNVVVTNPGPLTATRTGGFRYDGPPLVSVSLASGSITGGARETITGAFFVVGASVTFGGLAATNVVVVNSTTITVTTPAHQAGSVDVVVTLPDGTTETRASGYTYGSVAALPGPEPSATAGGSASALPIPRIAVPPNGSPGALPTPR